MNKLSQKNTLENSRGESSQIAESLSENSQSKSRWYEQDEKSKSGLGYFMMLFVLKCFPATFMRFMAFIVGFFYWIFSARDRRFSRDFLQAVKNAPATYSQPEKTKSAGTSTLCHFISFALNLVENVQTWAGNFSFKDVAWQDDDVSDLVERINSGKGAVCVVSHLGNAQMMKALASRNEAGTNRKISITSVMDIKKTGGFVKLINQVNPDSAFHIVSSDSIGPETVLMLQERLEQGELVVIAGDRIGEHSDRYIELPFLGKNAKLPYGVYLMLSLLNAPVYFIFGLRHKDITIRPSYDMFVHKSGISFDCPRKEREERIKMTAAAFLEQLEKHAKAHPYQWYNFFDFWA